MRRVLADTDPPAELSARAKAKLEEARESFPWLDDESTVIVRDEEGQLRGWTFAGFVANSALAELSFVHAETRPNDFAIKLEGSSDLSIWNKG